MAEDCPAEVQEQGGVVGGTEVEVPEQGGVLGGAEVEAPGTNELLPVVRSREILWWQPWVPELPPENLILAQF